MAKSKAEDKCLATLKKAEEKEEAQLQQLQTRRESRRTWLGEINELCRKKSKKQAIGCLLSGE